MRNVRKITTYLCTRCFHMFPDGQLARKHVRESHAGKEAAAPGPRRVRRGPTQTGRVYDAIKGGARTAKDVTRKTKIPLPRVHSLLTYLRNRGKVTGFAKDLRAK